MTYVAAYGRNQLRLACETSHHQGVVTPIGAVVAAKTGVKKWSKGQGMFPVSVKRSRQNFTSVKRSRCNSGRSKLHDLPH